MSKTRVALAILAGAVVGAVVVAVLQAEKMLDDEHPAEDSEEEENSQSILGNIARQFSERISADLKTAEDKIRSGVKKSTDFSAHKDEFGVFL